MPIDVSNTPDMYEIDATGSFTFNTKVGVRNDPNMDATPIIYYEPGESVNYSQKLKNGNHLWLSYVAASGETHYVPYVNTDTGEYFGTDSNASVQPIVPPTSTGTGTGTETGELGSLTGQAGADVADQTPDGTTLTESGQFTFSEPAAGRASTDMDAEHLDSWSIGETVYYNAKIKADGHYWFQYVNTNGSTYYVPYATISPFRYYGTDSNPGDPVIPQKDTGTTTTGTPRSHTGVDTAMPAMDSNPEREYIGEGDQYIYPTVGSLTLLSNAWGRAKPVMDPNNKANQIRLYEKNTLINYTGKLFNDNHLWVVLRNGQYLPVSTYANAEGNNMQDDDDPKNSSSYGYVTGDTGKVQPIEEYWPYTLVMKHGMTDVASWETADETITNIDATQEVIPSNEEIQAMNQFAAEIDATATDDSVSIAYITDTHVDSYKSLASARVLRSMQLMSYFANHYGVDLIVHGGDLNDGVKPKDLSEADIKRAMDTFKLSHRPFIVLQGNHDDNSGYARDETHYNGNQVITNNEAKPLRLDQFSQWLNVPTGSANPNNAIFGSYDVPNSDVTVLVLDGFDMPDYTDPTREQFRHGHTDYSDAQQNWLTETLAGIPSNRKIVVFDHIGLAGIGADSSYESHWENDIDVDTRYENTHAKSYQDGIKHSRAMYDKLTNYQSSHHNILGFFAGHTHRDNYKLSGSIQFVTSLCGIADRGDGRESRPLGSLTENGWGVIQLNPSKNQVIRHRFGPIGEDNQIAPYTDPNYFLKQWTIPDN
ncbi:SH3 domain-containing protein [Secundilactobacillus mixtipabuli]|uniref:Cell wall hydrolase n=1 Tax=Secundilactobacillus mixtipabuli TaxID=1435342 RepID=A0A1Z5IAA9_9LACO|nr:SH3 domain-containing protein [Secundilactobacillus mixtipabuli]GAW98674.1 cell wall hydrolase [Secundilactobacillus mixtipabuli]